MTATTVLRTTCRMTDEVLGVLGERGDSAAAGQATRRHIAALVQSRHPTPEHGLLARTLAMVCPTTSEGGPTS